MNLAEVAKDVVGLNVTCVMAMGIGLVQCVMLKVILFTEMEQEKPAKVVMETNTSNAVIAIEDIDNVMLVTEQVNKDI